jgi:hypothetical protein
MIMKKSFPIVVILFLTFISCKSNYTRIGDKNANYIPYYLKVYEADSLYIVGEHKRSYEILDSLFKKYEPINQESYIEYVTYLKNKIILNDFDKIDLVLKKAINELGYKPEYCVKDSLISIAVKKSNFNLNDLNEFYNNYVKCLNLNYRYDIEKMIANDQSVRLAVSENRGEWERVDMENAERIKILIAKYGYPSIKKIGRYDFTNKNSNVKLLFLHATKEERESYILDLMLTSVKKGECEPSDYATVYDKYMWTSGRDSDKVLYGELRDRKKSIDMVVVNPKKIDSIRKSIGLENIEYRRWKIMKMYGIDINNN